MAEGNGSGRWDHLDALLDKMGDRLDKIATISYLHEDRLSASKRISSRCRRTRRCTARHKG